ncbi:UNVERIFIED_CONTAM: Sphk2 [Trichonephila clavipes]
MEFICPSETVILEENFFSYPLTSVACNLILSEKVLFVGITTKDKTEVEKIFLDDIVGCHAFRGKNGKTKIETSEHSAYFCIYAYPLKTFTGILSKQHRREKRNLTFLMRKNDSEDENYKVVEKWQRAINCLIRGKACVIDGEVSIPDIVPSSKKFLILINPKSGPGKAYQIFKEKVIPLLVESDTQYEVLVTGFRLQVTYISIIDQNSFFFKFKEYHFYNLVELFKIVSCQWCDGKHYSLPAKSGFELQALMHCWC